MGSQRNIMPSTNAEGARARRGARKGAQAQARSRGPAPTTETHSAKPPQSGRNGAPAKPTAVMKRVVSDAADNVERALLSTADPVSTAMRIVGAAEHKTVIGQGALREPGAWAAYCDHLDVLTGKLRKNDLTAVEDMLFAQAIALQSLFVRLSEGALAAETIPNYDLKFRYALRAQSQCRATLETLATIKNPPLLFARQANVSNGPQQVNNTITGHPTDARARGLGSGQNELSGALSDGQLSTDGGASTLALTADPALAALGAIDGAADGRGQGALVPQRMEGRQRPRQASPAGKGIEAAKAKPRGSGEVK